MKPTKLQIERFIDEINELERMSDRRPLSKIFRERYRHIHGVVYLGKDL